MLYKIHMHNRHFTDQFLQPEEQLGTPAVKLYMKHNGYQARRIRSALHGFKYASMSYLYQEI